MKDETKPYWFILHPSSFILSVNALSFPACYFRMGLSRGQATRAGRRGKYMPGNWIVRHGAMRFLGEFDPENGAYARGDEVVARTDRGLELGQVLSPATPEAVSAIGEPTHGRLVR